MVPPKADSPASSEPHSRKSPIASSAVDGAHVGKTSAPHDSTLSPLSSGSPDSPMTSILAGEPLFPSSPSSRKYSPDGNRSASPSLPSASAASLTSSIPTKLQNKSRWYVQPIPPFSGLASADSRPTGGNSGAADSRPTGGNSGATGTVSHPARPRPLPQSSIKSNSKAPQVLPIESVKIPANVEIMSTEPLAVLEQSTAALCSMEEVPNARENKSNGSKPLTSTALAPLREALPSLEENEISAGSKPLASVAPVPNNPASSTRLGAWAKPLIISSGMVNTTSKSHKQVQQVSQTSSAKEDDARFPWAARMDRASRNLYRATEPEYLEDGTPKVIIPDYVLAQGIENQKEFILGQFFRCSPPPAGLIFAVLNKIWGTKCKINIKKLSETSYLFHIPDKSTRAWVVQRGLWHVDDCLLFVAPRTPEATLAIPEIKTIPVWVTLKKIPNLLYTIPAISHIASGLGAPMATYKPILDPFHMGEAKVLVEVELSKAFPPKIAASDEKGFISMVDVEYAWIPSTCSRCGQLGHKVKRCLEPQPETSNVLSDAIFSIPTSPSTKAVHAPSLEVVLTTPTPTHQSPASAPVKSLEVAPPKVAVTSSPVPNVEKVSTLLNLSVSEKTHATISSPTEVIHHTNSGSTDFPPLDIAPLGLSTSSPRTHASTHREGKQQVNGLGPNQFASLASSGDDEVSSDSDVEPESMDLMTPPGKRILRDRPVKPTAKASENTWQIKGRGRGGRGRGGRGGRG